MDFVTVRELRAESGRVWERIAAGEEIVLTRNGKPFALLLPTEPADLETVLRAHRAARLGAAVRRLRDQARARGTARLSGGAIQAEIDAVRRQRASAVGRARRR